jgi:hypothetical protein
MNPMMDRDTWLRRILDATRDLADVDYQERVWVRGEGPEVDSSTETLIRLLDDYDLPSFIAEAADKAWISNAQLTALRKLEATLARYAAGDQSGDEAVRIARPKWQRVRAAAEATLETFRAPAASA